MVAGCAGGVGFILCNREGGRRVLVMGGSHSPVIIRDAFSGTISAITLMIII